MTYYREDIEEFNKNLISKFIDLNQDQYLTKLRDKLFPDIDLSFRKLFRKASKSEDKFCIHHKNFINYGIYSQSYKISVIKENLNSNNMIEGKDYVIKVSDSSKQNIYLTIDAFKICILDVRTCDKYRKYCMFIEICLPYYIQFKEGILDNKYNTLKFKLGDIQVDNNNIKRKLEDIQDTLTTEMKRRCYIRN